MADIQQTIQEIERTDRQIATIEDFVQSPCHDGYEQNRHYPDCQAALCQRLTLSGSLLYPLLADCLVRQTLPFNTETHLFLPTSYA
jgi:hypothetical protein